MRYNALIMRQRTDEWITAIRFKGGTRTMTVIDLDAANRSGEQELPA